MSNWTRTEIIVALNVYCKIPFKESSSRHPIIQEYAKLIGRTPAALNLKIGNLGSFDPELKKKGIVGLKHTSKLDEMIWNEFFDNPEDLAFESEKIIADYKHQTIEESTSINQKDIPEGIERLSIVKQRVNQKFFHDAILCSYNYQCCITGLSNASLLEACHIVPWRDDVKNRTNPRNGLCMNPLFHKAFDNFLFSVSPDYKIIISSKMIEGTMNNSFRSFLLSIQGKNIIMPEKFFPDRELLERQHEVFKRNYQ